MTKYIIKFVLSLLLLFGLVASRPVDLSLIRDEISHSKSSSGLQAAGKRRLLGSDNNRDPGAVIRPSRKAHRKSEASRIAWGNEAYQGMFSFAIYFDATEYMCSGSVIHPRAILTAAHCVRGDDGWTNVADISIYLGNVAIEQTETYYVEAMYTPRYDTDTLYGDIAIVQLTEEIPYYVKPVALANSSTNWSGIKTATAIGWGTTENGELPSVLRYADVAVISAEKCLDVHDEYLGEKPKDHMCFGLNTDPVTSTCSGDSGGPYVISRNGGEPVQVAVVSYGPSQYECGDFEDNLDVPTNVTYWRPWIDATLNAINLSS